MATTAAIAWRGHCRARSVASMSAPANTVVQIVGAWRRDAAPWRHAGPRLARRASADGIDDDHQRPFGVTNRRVYGLGRARLFDSQTGQVFSHRFDQHLLNQALIRSPWKSSMGESGMGLIDLQDL